MVKGLQYYAEGGFALLHSKWEPYRAVYEGSGVDYIFVLARELLGPCGAG